MLSPPNRGSEIVDFLLPLPFSRWFMGPAGQELGTGPDAAIHRLKPIGIEVGVIAGDRSMNLLFSVFIDGADDGRVSVKNTMLPEMRDFITVPSTHTYIVKDPLAMRQVAHFIKHGMFDHGTP